MRSAHAKDNFAENVSLADASMGFGGFFERELGCDRDLQICFLYGAIQFFKFTYARFRIVRINFHTAEFFGFGLDSVWIRKAAAWSKDIEAAKNGFATAENEHCVDALGRKIESSLDKVHVMAIHSDISTETLHESDAFLSGRHADNLRASFLGELNGESAHCARRAVNHDVLSRLDVEVIADSLKRCEPPSWVRPLHV